MHALLSPLFVGQLQNLHKTILADFRANVLAKMKSDSYNFAEVIATNRTQAEQAFIKEATTLVLQDTDWSFDDSLATLRADITSIATDCRVEETKKMITSIEVSFPCYLCFCHFVTNLLTQA